MNGYLLLTAVVSGALCFIIYDHFQKRKKKRPLADRADPVVIPFAYIRYCPTCDVFHSSQDACPQCGGGASFTFRDAFTIEGDPDEIRPTEVELREMAKDLLG